MIRDRLHLLQCSFSTPFLASTGIYSVVLFSCKSINYTLLSLLESFTWARQTLVLRIDTKCSWSASFSLNVELPLPSAMLFYTDPYIDLSRERIDQIIGKSIIKITSQSKGVEREISIIAAHQIRPDRYSFSFAIRTDFIVSCFAFISCASAQSAPAWSSVSLSSLSSKIFFPSLEGSSYSS